MLSKPSWLVSLLASLNWDVLTWRIYVGDAVEDGIDWLLDWVNYGISLAQTAWDYADSLLDNFWSLLNSVKRQLLRDIDNLGDRIDDFWYDLKDWWSDTKRDVWLWIEETADDLQRVIDRTRDIAENAHLRLDTFFEYDLPNYVDILQLSDAILSLQQSIGQTLNGLLEFKDTVTTFLDNPFEYLLDKFANWFLGEE